jgi:hypothetical protein
LVRNFQVFSIAIQADTDFKQEGQEYGRTASWAYGRNQLPRALDE